MIKRIRSLSSASSISRRRLYNVVGTEPARAPGVVSVLNATHVLLIVQGLDLCQILIN